MRPRSPQRVGRNACGSDLCHRRRQFNNDASCNRFPWNRFAFHPTARTLNFVVSTHAAEELDDDNLTILDLENIILTGQVIERQRDVQTREIKCALLG